MMRFRLNLKLHPTAAHPPAAWFIPGADAAAWLDEIARWGVPMAGLRLYVLPQSLADATPCGVLVVPAGQTPKGVVRGQPYGCLAGRLYVPVDARLDPRVADDELGTALVWDVQVLHPSAGLVGFGASDVVRVHNLLEPPAQRDVPWDRAPVGESFAPRLLSVEPEEVPTVESILGEGRGDIGSAAPQELPRSPNESTAKDIRNALARAGQPALKLLSWLASKAPGAGVAAGAAGGSWLGKLQEWASDKLDRIAAGLESARLKELERLQHLLSTDPDQGLRYAIPLRDAGSRGRAMPGARLTPRIPNFTLAGLGGGLPGDPWAVPWETQQRLIAQYRNAANRELNLGRYRRAAYIFAELLGDYSAAANALEQGRHFREAAALYREHLGAAQKAAECLERGGLLLEAVAIYEEIGGHEKAGDLYATLERPEDATRCWRLAVDRRVEAGDPLAAARLLENKLRVPDEALALLSGAWPASDRAGICLREAFALLGRLGRHDDAAVRLARLRSDIPAADRAATLANVLSTVAATYPNPAARTLAADTTRVVAGNRLRWAVDAEKADLVKAVTALSPEDRLLSRDGDRYLSRRRTAPPRSRLAKGPSAPADRREPVVVHQFHLPEGFAWQAAASTGREFYCLGERAGGAYLLRGRWDGAMQVVAWKPAPGPRSSAFGPAALHPHAHGPRVALVPIGDPPVAGAAHFPATDAFREPAGVDCPRWLPTGGVLGMCYDEHGTAWAIPARQIGGPVHLNVYAPRSGNLIRMCGLVAPLLPPTPPLLTARKGTVFVAWGEQLFMAAPEMLITHESEPLPSPVRTLAASAPFTRLRVAAGLEEGGVIFWEADRHPFGEGMPSPHVAFTRGGYLIAVSAGEGRVYRTDDGRARHHCTFRAPAEAPMALVPTSKINEFAVFGVGGLVRVLQVGV